MFIFQMFDDDINSDTMEGEMTVAQKTKGVSSRPGHPDFNTLDEPIKETFVSTFFNPK
jgi:hypothetical protein